MRATLLSLALAPLAMASPFQKRQTTSGGLSNLLSDISIMTNSLESLDGNVLLVVHSPEEERFRHLQAVFSDSQTCIWDAGNLSASLDNSPTFDAADSANLGAALVSSLEPAITSLVSNLVAHQATASVSAPEILATLGADAMAFASGVIGKVSGSIAFSEAYAASTSLASLFASANSAMEADNTATVGGSAPTSISKGAPTAKAVLGA